MTEVFANGRWVRLAPHEKLSKYGRWVFGPHRIREDQPERDVDEAPLSEKGSTDEGD